MNQNWESYRTDQRVFFSHKTGLTALLSLPIIRSSIPVKILDISLGGMGCTMQRHQNLIFHKNDFLNLIEFYNLERKRVIANISMEIRWVLDTDNFNSIGMGLRFIDPPDEMTQHLITLINQGLKARNLEIQKIDTQEFVKKRIQK